MTTPIVQVRHLTKRFGDFVAVNDISFDIQPGEILGLLGPNGAGKTTTIQMMLGLITPTGGTIRMFALDLATHREVIMQQVNFSSTYISMPYSLTVEENLRTGAFLRKDKAGIEKDLDAVFEHFPRLKERRKQWARQLSGGEQQMLAIGRALMSRPKMLVLDEPSMGLAPVMVQEIARIVREIVERGVPVVLVEQNAELALTLARYAYVLETGSIALEGPAHELHDNAHVRRAYLGG